MPILHALPAFFFTIGLLFSQCSEEIGFIPGTSKGLEYLLRVSFTSKKAADVVYSEVKNILPMLSRHYGELSLTYDTHARYGEFTYFCFNLVPSFFTYLLTH